MVRFREERYVPTCRYIGGLHHLCKHVTCLPRSSQIGKAWRLGQRSQMPPSACIFQNTRQPISYSPIAPHKLSHRQLHLHLHQGVIEKRNHRRTFGSVTFFAPGRFAPTPSDVMWSRMCQGSSWYLSRQLILLRGQGLIGCVVLVALALVDMNGQFALQFSCCRPS